MEQAWMRTGLPTRSNKKTVHPRSTSLREKQKSQTTTHLCVGLFVTDAASCAFAILAVCLASLLLAATPNLSKSHFGCLRRHIEGALTRQAATNFSAGAEIQAALLVEVGDGTARQKGEHMPRPTLSQTGLEPKTCAKQALEWSKHGSEQACPHAATKKTVHPRPTSLREKQKSQTTTYVAGCSSPTLTAALFSNHPTHK